MVGDIAVTGRVEDIAIGRSDLGRRCDIPNTDEQGSDDDDRRSICMMTIQFRDRIELREPSLQIS